MRGDENKFARASSVLGRIESMPRVCGATAPVLGFHAYKKWQFLGSAILVKINNWHFVLTAAHVLDNPSCSDLHIGSGNKVISLQGSYASIVPPNNGNREQDKIDIGIVRLSEETVRDMQEDEFLALDDIYNSDTATITGHYVFAGYPCSKHKRAIKEGEAEAALYSFAVDTAPLTDYQDAGLDPCISLLLRFNKNNLWNSSGQAVGPDPTGISGGGVWFIGDAFATTPFKPLLTAIAVEWWWRVEPKRVLATKLHVILSAIWNRFPELRSYLPKPPDKGGSG
ncbi:MAG: hypothetical protein ACYC4A_00765 [Desulfobulbia bacterium]